MVLAFDQAVALEIAELLGEHALAHPGNRPAQLGEAKRPSHDQRVDDLAFATLKAVGAEMYRYPMGGNWYILNFYVPMLVVSQVMIILLLVRRRNAPR